jgi:hypothetical protein
MSNEDFFMYQMSQNLLNSAAYIEECACCKPITNEEMWLTLGWLVIFMVVTAAVCLAICLVVTKVMDKFSK